MGSRVTGMAIALVVACFLAPASALGAADLSASVTADPAVLSLAGPGKTEVTIAVTNAGPDPAMDVKVTSTVGTPELLFTGFVGISQGTAVFVPGSDPPVSVSFGELPPDATATVKFVLDDVQSGRGLILAETTTETPEAGFADNRGSESIDVTALITSPVALPFGVQTLGTATSRTVMLSNQAAIPVKVSGVHLEGGDFAVATNGCTGVTLAVEQSCQISVGFAPKALADRLGLLTIASSTEKVTSVDVSLFGTGSEPPDSQGASLKLTGVPKSIGAAKFRRGFSAKLTPSEAAALDVELLGKARRGALASAFDLMLFGRSLPLGVGTRTIKVKPKTRLLGSLRRRFKVRLQIVATDLAGNRSFSARTIVVRPAAPRRR